MTAERGVPGRRPISIERSRLDAPEVTALIHDMWTELDGRYSDLSEDEAESPQRTRAEDFVPPAGSFLVAMVDGGLAGCGGIRRLDTRTAEVKRMYVVPEFRRAGVARAVLKSLEDEARSLGYRAVRLETGVRQPEAIALYASSGYHPIPCYGRYAQDELSRCFEKELGGTPP